ncbi:MAG: hypothetical protein C0454_16865 [Parvibaculum sp.]|jgi:CheY-like chemotaxis protein|nr:hypothetical protein [Parvibaculum sp.]
MPALASLIEALATLLWPVAAILGAIWALPRLEALAKSRGLTIKIAGNEISVSDAADSLTRQVDDLRQVVERLAAARPLDETVERTRTAYETSVDGLPTEILWVDDNPENNALEIAQLESRGFDVLQAVTTSEALNLISIGFKPFAILSDMGRTEHGTYNKFAGIELLKELRKNGNEAPFYVYTTQQREVAVDELVRKNGGSGATASTSELFEWISLTQLKSLMPTLKQRPGN